MGPVILFKLLRWKAVSKNKSHPYPKPNQQRNQIKCHSKAFTIVGQYSGSGQVRSLIATRKEGTYLN